MIPSVGLAPGFARIIRADPRRNSSETPRWTSPSSTSWTRTPAITNSSGFSTPTDWPARVASPTAISASAEAEANKTVKHFEDPAGLGAHDDRERALWAVRRVGTFDVHRMEPRVEEHEAFVGPQEARPHRDAHDLGAAVGEEGRTREIDEPRAQQRELEQAASVRSRDA